jgi:signal transduction histidine kinase
VSDARSGQLRLRAYLAARLQPLAILLVVVVSSAAPIATFALGMRNLRDRAHATAKQVADVVGADVEQVPLLWKYDTPKLLAQVRGYEVPGDIVRVEVVDHGGVPLDDIDEGELVELAARTLVWQVAPVVVDDARVAEVWVAASTDAVRRDALLVLLVFGALGSLLGSAMYFLPMRSIARAEGEIAALLDRLEASQAELERLAEGLEQQVEARASELRAAYRELQRKEQNLRELSSRAVALQETERRAIARDLHDSAGQALTAIRINLQLAGDLLAGTDRDKVREIVQRTTAMVDDTVEEIRRAVNTLGPAVLHDVGLVAAVRRACDDIAEGLAMEVDCAIELPRELSPALEATCYRVVQEALTNVARHAEAGRVEVRLSGDDGAVRVVVRDDGRGFDPRSVPADHRGLVGMRERIELLGGRLEIDAAPGKGTRVDATIPLT